MNAIFKLKKVISTQIAGNKVRGNGKNIILQCALIFVSLGLILMLYEMFGGFIVASLGASSFILFVTPHKNSSRSANLIGGYLIGTISGILFNFLLSAFNSLGYGWMPFALILMCAFSTTIAILLMLWVGFAHPPAAALALGLVVDSYSLRTAVAAILGTIILCTVRYLLRNHLKNLI